jgi:phage shock protein PspC (stress-responsive transcriptional regulator)
MTCDRCLRELEVESSYCRFCGARTGDSGAEPRRLTRMPEDGHLAGVCAGLAAYVNADVTLIRLAVAALAVVPGVLIGGLVAYAIAWALMPAAEPGTRLQYTGKRLVRSGTNRYLAGVCGGLAEYLRLDSTIVRVVAAILAVYPGAIIGGLLVYVVAWIIIPGEPQTFETASTTA